MRIVGGRLKGSALTGPKSQAIRPTTDRMRESLFNILEHRYGKPAEETRVLDLFSGTGAIGMEALSRGARFALFVEDAVEARGLIRHNLDALGLTGQAKIFRRDATRIGRCAPMAPFDLVFADPPYRKGLGEKALAAALAGGWIAPGALCVLEDDRRADVAIPDGLAFADERAAGDTILRFLRAQG